MGLRNDLESALKAACIGKRFDKEELRVADGYVARKSFVVRIIQFLGDVVILANDDVTYISEWLRLDDVLTLADEGFIRKDNDKDGLSLKYMLS